MEDSEFVFKELDDTAEIMERGGLLPDGPKEEMELRDTLCQDGTCPKLRGLDIRVQEGLETTAERIRRNVLVHSEELSDLCPEDKIRKEEEFETPPRGGDPRRWTSFQTNEPRDSMIDMGPVPDYVAARRMVPANRNRPSNTWSPVETLEGTVLEMRRDMENLQTENRFLRTRRIPGPVPLVRQVALTTTKVPGFNGSTSWEQYQQVFDAIALSNGWGDATAALPFGRESLTAVVRPGLADRERQTASAESEGLDASWHERANGRVTAPVIPGSRDVHRRRRNEPVDRSCPVDIHILSEPSVRFKHRTERLDDTVVGPEGHEGCLGAPHIGSPRYDSTGSRHRIDEPVFPETRVYTNTGPLGFIVELGGCITNWPDPVGHSGEMEQSVFAGLKADREGCIPSDRVRPGMMMFSARPERDVSGGPDEARRSEDHVSPSPVHDEDRQVIGGPVGRFPSSDILLTDDGSVLSKDRRDDVISRQYEVVPFTDVPRTTEHRDDRPGAVDFDGTTQTRSESGMLKRDGGSFDSEERWFSDSPS